MKGTCNEPNPFFFVVPSRHQSDLRFRDRNLDRNPAFVVRQPLRWFIDLQKQLPFFRGSQSHFKSDSLRFPTFCLLGLMQTYNTRQNRAQRVSSIILESDSVRFNVPGCRFVLDRSHFLETSAAPDLSRSIPIQQNPGCLPATVRSQFEPNGLPWSQGFRLCP